MKILLGHVHERVGTLNNSKLFAGLLMLLMNIGSKYITVKLSDSQEAYLRNNVAREFIIFAVCWMGTRDVFLSIILTSAFYILTQHLFNETSPLCLLPEKHRKYHLTGLPAEGSVSDADLKAALNTVKLAHEQKSASDADRLYTYFSDTRI